MQVALSSALVGDDRVAGPHLADQLAQGVAPGMVHGRGHGPGRGHEGLHLIRLEAVLFQPQGQVEHVLVGGARVGGDEVGDQVLLLARVARKLLEHGPELLEAAHTGLHHLRQRPVFGVLRRDLEVAAHVVGDQLLDVLGRGHRQVVAQARGDHHLLDPVDVAGPAVQLDQRRVVRAQVGADIRIHARRQAAGRLDFRRLAGHAPHVGRGPAQVRNHTRESRGLVPDGLDFPDDGALAAALDDASLVLGDGAEGAAPEAPPHDVHRVLDHVVGGDGRLAVGRVGHPGVGTVEDRVDLGRGQGHRRRVQPHVATAMALHQGPRVARVGLRVHDPRGVGVQHGVVRHLFIGGQTNHRAVALLPALAQFVRRVGQGLGSGNRGRRGGAPIAAGSLPGVGVGMVDEQPGRVQLRRIHFHPPTRYGPAHEGGAADVGQVADVLAGAQAVGDLQDLPLAVAIDQQVGLGVGQHRTPHLVRPVVVVGDAPQAGLDAADHHGHALEGLAAPLGVDQHGAVRTFPALAAGGVGVVAAQPALGGVAVDHGVHVARGDAEEQIGGTEGTEGFGALPVGLGDDPHPETLGFEHAADHGHAETGMVHVGIARDDDDVARFPAQLVHLAAAHGQLAGQAERRGPVAGARKQGHGGRHGGHGQGPAGKGFG